MTQMKLRERHPADIKTMKSIYQEEAEDDQDDCDAVNLKY